jgi:DNA-binding MarR family transcriptional regulator
LHDPGAEPPDPHIGRLLRETFALFERRLHAGLHAAGVTEIRPTHHAVLRHLDIDGTRATELAERSGLTRQALTQIIDDLEALGYVARRPDPEDRRAKLVVYTDRGLHGYRAGRETIARMEREFADLLGDEDYGRMRAALERLMREG